MELTSTFTYNGHSSPQVSASGQYIAYINGSKLVVRGSRSLAIKSIVQLPNEFACNVIIIRWDRCLPHSSEQRLAIASRDEIRTFSIDNGDDRGSEGNATILPRNEVADIEWLSCHDTQSDTEIVRLAVFSKYGLNMTIWSSDGIELTILSPKFSRTLGIPQISLDGNSSNYSIVGRLTTSDVVLTACIDCKDNRNIKKILLAKTQDVVDVKWSPSGLWLAAVDNPAAGYNVYLWAADGTFLNSYHGSVSGDEPPMSSYRLGAKCTEWLTIYNDPGRRDTELLLVGDLDGRVSILDLKNFQPISVLVHGSIYEGCCVWEEYLSPESRKLEYRLLSLPFHLPNTYYKRGNSSIGSASGVIPSSAVASMQLSENGELLATKLESIPQMVWIWSILDEKNPVLLSVICHASPIRNLQWKSNNSATGLLLIVPSENHTISIWDYNNQLLQPKMYEWSPDFDSSLTGATIVPNNDESLRILAWSSKSFAVGSFSDGQQGNHAYSEQHRMGSPELLRDDDTRVRELANGVQQSEWGQSVSSYIPLEDTFHKHLKI